MSIRFPLPVNNLKRETSAIEKAHFYSHVDGERYSHEIAVPRNIHTAGVKISFYVSAYRVDGSTTAELVGKRVTLEENEIFYYPDYRLVQGNEKQGFFITFRAFQRASQYILSLQLTSTYGLLGEVWIEKISVIDSDFDNEKGWLYSGDEDNIRDIVIPLPDEISPPEPPVFSPISPMDANIINLD